MTRRARPLALALLAGSLAAPAAALDVGDPWFDEATPGPPVRLEVAYVDLRRGVELQSQPMRLGTAASGPAVVGPTLPPVKGHAEIEHALLRLSASPTARLAGQVDIGIGGSDDDGDHLVLVGGALRVLIGETGPLRLAAQASGHWISPHTERMSGVDPSWGSFAAIQKSDYSEAGVALLGSFDAPLGEVAWLSVYGGPRFSAFGGSVDAVFDYENPIVVGGTPVGDRIWLSGETEQESLFGIVVGARVDLGDVWTLRTEARLVEESSFTVSVGAGF
ncbi:hypothetical protein [Botrimarina sp.]|uniref:hypothetical protein n=1 Tax=Botrimarina sp. TaxID=2795802 RepID=UPI0032ED4CA6